MKNCNGCKWSCSDDRNRLCPRCNSNYDMFEPKPSIITKEKIKEVSDILYKQKLKTGFEIKVFENPLMEEGRAALFLNPIDYKKYIEKQKLC